MVEATMATNPAVEASERALAKVYQCLDNRESFLVEAGAGAGKTYTLVRALQHLIDTKKHVQPRSHQQVACITFTNVAKSEIEEQIDRSPIVFCDTIHAFCWSLIAAFQKDLRAQVAAIPAWTEKFEEAGEILNRKVEYTLGHRRITDEALSLHHDDVLLLTIALMENPKFRLILARRYPVILIDEYQDTNAGWIESIKQHYLGQDASPLFGFFGDHWQKIYGDGCGSIEHDALIVIGKRANFRSVPVIVEFLNRMRPELPQFPSTDSKEGSVRVFHTNAWRGNRKTGGHWGGDMPDEESNQVLGRVQETLEGDGWDLSAQSTKILMLTHRVLATKQGYSSIPNVFRYNDAFTRKESVHIAYFSNILEPSFAAYRAKRYGQMFEIVGARYPSIKSQQDKTRWSESMDALDALRESGTVGEVIDHLRQSKCPQLPDAVERLERRREQFDPKSGEEKTRPLIELEKLREVPYTEIIELSGYLAGHSPFETKHGVKGAQFENVLVIAGRGWNKYNFKKMLELARDPSAIPANDTPFYENNRNLFYVACSRPKKRLALLFTQELSDQAMDTLRDWFGHAAIETLDLT